VETATQTLHRLTSYGAEWYRPLRLKPFREWPVPVDDPRILRDLDVLDTSRLPWFYKRYSERLDVIALPRELPATTAQTVSVLAGSAEVEPAELDLPQLSRLLHLSAGVTRTTVRPYATWLFRAAGTEWGRFPVELYVVVRE